MNPNQASQPTSGSKMSIEETSHSLYRNDPKSGLKYRHGYDRLIIGRSPETNHTLARICLIYDLVEPTPYEYKAQLYHPNSHNLILGVTIFKGNSHARYIAQSYDPDSYDTISEITTRLPLSIMDACQQSLPIIKLGLELHASSEASLEALNSSLSQVDPNQDLADMSHHLAIASLGELATDEQ